MKKKTIFILSFVVSMLIAFAGCGESSTFAIVSNEDQELEITAENADDDMMGATGTFVVGEGDMILIEPNFEEGKVLVEFFPFDGSDEDADIDELTAEGEPTFDVEISGTEPIECGFQAGEYMVNAKVLEKATGTAIISTFNEEEESGWTKAASAAEAAKGAGNMEEFELPAELKINDLTFTDPQYSYQDGVAQAYYESGAIGISVRKACGVYGGPMTDRDLESFPEHWTQQVGDDADDTADCYGMQKDAAIVASWGDEEEFFTVTSQGLGGEEYAMDAATVDWLEEMID